MSAPLPPEAFAELVRQADDAQLEAGLQANRDVILGEVFRQMPAHLDTEAAAGIDAVVEWRIGGREDGGQDVWQLAIRDGRAEVAAGEAAEPTVSFAIGALDFMKLVAGAEDGPRLFLFGRLKVTGDLVLGVQMPALFRLPGAA